MTFNYFFEGLIQHFGRCILNCVGVAVSPFNQAHHVLTPASYLQKSFSSSFVSQNVELLFWIKLAFLNQSMSLELFFFFCTSFLSPTSQRHLNLITITSKLPLGVSVIWAPALLWPLRINSCSKWMDLNLAQQLVVTATLKPA